MYRIDPRASIPSSSRAPSVVQLAHNVPGRYQGRELTVSSRHMNEMQAVRTGIAQVERFARFGSSNQQADGLRTGGEVAKRYYARETLEDDGNIDAFDIRGQATITVQAQGANCGGKNALLMAVLSQPGSGVERPINYVRSPGGQHYYLAIGDHRVEREKDMGYADAWPTLASPMMLRDSLMWDSYSTNQIRATHAPGSAPILSAQALNGIAPLSQAEIDRRAREKSGSDDAGIHLAALRRHPDVQQQTHTLRDTGLTYVDRDVPGRRLRQETSAARFNSRYGDPLSGEREKAPMFDYPRERRRHRH